ncbi:hypothetical protein CRM22_001733 [Opisthorchis felineus]|uniref:J domain-containing protein n=1 Tax=Opisthorchis felineus TaxID=147828 RepID=A0A4S2MDL7_OPIFE|nr:hypothetical protein CRM22_001733 [Opisthorchis felineus]
MKCFLSASLKKFTLYISALIYLHFPGKFSVCASVEDLLEQGTRLLAAGQLADALSVYVQAVDADPHNHLTYYRRGTAHLALGNVRLALPDFDQSVKLNGGFIPAIRQRAMLHLKMGHLHEAKSDFGLLVPSDPEASEKLTQITMMEEQLDAAPRLFREGRTRDALRLLDSMAEVMNFNPEVRELRAQCYLRLGDVQKGVHEMRYGVRLLNDNREGLLKLAQLMYDSGLAVQSVEELRECLRLDQDDKNCMRLYKVVKKLAKDITQAQEAMENSRFKDCIKHADSILKLEPSHREYQNQAKLLLSIRTAQKVFDTDRRHQRAREILQKAQRLLKTSQRKDYYKILGVSRSATKQEIASAYRKLARKWHPDRYEGEDKKKAEREFLLISSAKEVLTDDDVENIHMKFYLP